MVTGSALYEGTVQHSREKTVRNDFTVNLSMVYLDLDELPELFDWIPGWSARRPSLAWFREADHFGQNGNSLKESVLSKVEFNTGKRLNGPVRLLTLVRFFGYLFNPVSFYFCYDGGERLRTVLAEVHNTPWHEEHIYVLPADQIDPEKGLYSVNLNKEFHVSPFQPMEQSYNIVFGEPTDDLKITIQNRRENQNDLTAQLMLKRKPFTPRNAIITLLKFPFLTMKVTATIYIQALILWYKGANFHTHPKRKKQ